MRMVFGLVLILGMGLAGLAVYMAKDFISASQSETERLKQLANSRVETVQVFVVTRQVRYGERLEKEDVKLVRWPVDSLPEGIFTFPATPIDDETPGVDLFPKDSDKRRSVLRTMELGEPVLALKVTQPGKSAGITSRLTKGMRAFAIKVDVTSGVSGFLRPGDYVDVYWTGRPPNSEIAGNITKLIQSGIRLIAIDQSANDDIGDANVARSVTVEVSPQQVAALAQAQGSGRLSLSLVGTNDVSDIGAIEITQNDLLGIVEKVKVVEEEAAEKSKCYITTRRAGSDEKIQTEVECRD